MFKTRALRALGCSHLVGVNLLVLERREHFADSEHKQVIL